MFAAFLMFTTLGHQITMLNLNVRKVDRILSFTRVVKVLQGVPKKVEIIIIFEEMEYQRNLTISYM